LFSLLRSESAARKLAELGASVALVSAFDMDAVERALREAEAEVVIDQLTSLPKDPAHLAAALPGDRKLRIEGGGNLYRAAEANGVRRYLQQSSGFFLKPGDGLADESESLAVNASPGVAWSARMYTELETRALSSNQMEGVVLRSGFFYGPGAAAEYCIAKPTEIAKKPTAVNHLQAAVVPISALTAWQGLFDRGNLQPGQKALIHGGAGGVGSFAIQLAAWKGAFVITTVSEPDSNFVRELGAREVIDYRKARFDELVTDADLVLDLVGGDTLRASFRAIKPAGRVITIATSSESETDHKIKEAFFIVAANPDQLREISKLIDTGLLRPVVREVAHRGRCPSILTHEDKGPR
jgi:hypothetical protein